MNKSLVLLLLSIAIPKVGLGASFEVPRDTATLYKNLKEVTVVGDVPLAKVLDNGAISYKAENLQKFSNSMSIMGMLEAIPLLEMDYDYDKFKVSGSVHTTLILNGRKSLLSESDLYEQLKALPPTCVKSIEVYYSAPASMGTRGAVINVELYKFRSDKLKYGATLHTELYHASHYYQVGGAQCQISMPKLSVDGFFSLGTMNKEKNIDFYSTHTVDGVTHQIENLTRYNLNYYSYKVGAQLSYDTPAKGTLEAFVQHRVDHKPYSFNTVLRDYATRDVVVPESRNVADKPTYATTAIIDYTKCKLKLGGEYMYRTISDHQQLMEDADNATVLDYSVKQRSSSLSTHGSYTLSCGPGELSVGFTSLFTYLHQNKNVLNVFTCTTEHSEFVLAEDMANLHLAWSQKWGKKLSVNATGIVQYYTSHVKDDDEKLMLWNRTTFFPSFNMQYNYSDRLTYQYSFSSDRIFPAYSNIWSNRVYYSSYFHGEGNPELKPYTFYQSNLNMLYSKKYIWGFFYNWAPNYELHQYYQKANMLQMVDKRHNLDQFVNYGTQFVFPLKLTNWWNLKGTVKLAFFYYKGDIEQYHIDRTCLSPLFRLLQIVTLNRAQRLTLTATCDYCINNRTGINIIDNRWYMSGVLNWNPPSSGWMISLKVIDPFQTREKSVFAHVFYDDLNHADYRIVSDNSCVNLNIRYNLGYYKEKKKKSIDESRFDI